MDPVSIPVRVDWRTMMSAKLANALRPGRLLLFFVTTCSFGIWLAVKAECSLLGSIA